ncbi:methyl-accepting chemotaxis protein [Hyalangium rubrum]|uniref:Methyl-accepting chemotaxis protein n=1 Tax=Hyalangium rubrum TaxID=3103134 RepID=A0ABU5H623_9BACT|nr:methyl-accepting chemotaxis protein [Hyalangium sp. s54d21]MDY7227545.1 methyl-accepting chemotaxis protein [Hyalangium sp. s54d21]
MKASIGQRVYVSFGLLVVAFAILGGAHIASSNRLAREVESSLERSFAVAMALFKLRTVHQQTTVLLASAFEGSTPDASDRLAVLEESFADSLGALKEQGYPEERLEALEQRFAEAMRLGRALVAAAAEPQPEEAQGIASRFHNQTRELEQLLERMSQQEATRVRSSFQELRLNFRWGARIFGVGVMGCITVALLLAFGLRRSLVRPLRELTRVTRDISQDGDLTLVVPVRSGDEVGQLAGAFREMVERLRLIHQELRSSSGTLSESATHMRFSAERQQATVGTQAMALQQTRVTAEELRQTSAMAAQRADAVLKVVERADALGREGEASIASSVNGMAELQDQVRQIAERIRHLGESTQQIGNITRTVKDLADQSNVLALNAAIEAARSGEHGKGFGVVAREIRSLADRSIQATVRVRELLDTVGHSVTETVTITQKGAERMQLGLDQVRATGESLREISAIIRGNALAVRQIALAVSQQDAGIGLIFEAVNELSTMMEDTERQLDTTKGAAVALEDVSRKLTDMVTRYRT